MSAEILRRAAVLMRDRAEAATRPRFAGLDEREPTWDFDGNPSGAVMAGRYCIGQASAYEADASSAGRLATHIASWHPAVALAAALGMDCTAEGMELRPDARITSAERAWIDFARAYLGESA